MNKLLCNKSSKIWKQMSISPLFNKEEKELRHLLKSAYGIYLSNSHEPHITIQTPNGFKIYRGKISVDYIKSLCEQEGLNIIL